MAASTKPSSAAFIAALTATNQLTRREQQQARRADKDALKEARYCAWMKACAAFHRASSASLLACCGRVLQEPDREILNGRHVTAIVELIEAAERLMPLPLVNRDDLVERRTLIRKWCRTAATPDTKQLWDAAEQRWTALLDAAAGGLA